MILLDTHIWVWLADESSRISAQQNQIILDRRKEGLAISAISCWEVAKLVEYQRLKLACSVGEWMEAALRLPDIELIELTPQIAIAQTKLPGRFHRDPADQIIVATARVYDLSLLTADDKILKYKHVKTLQRYHNAHSGLADWTRVILKTFGRGIYDPFRMYFLLKRDVQYIEKASLKLDMEIMWRTVKQMIGGEAGAH